MQGPGLEDTIPARSDESDIGQHLVYIESWRLSHGQERRRGGTVSQQCPKSGHLERTGVELGQHEFPLTETAPSTQN